MAAPLPNGRRSDEDYGDRRRPVVVYGDGAEREREEESENVPKDQQLTRSMKPHMARRGEVGRRRWRARTVAAGGGEDRDGDVDSSDPGTIPSA